jgi:hypothetical protein
MISTLHGGGNAFSVLGGADQTVETIAAVQRPDGRSVLLAGRYGEGAERSPAVPTPMDIFDVTDCQHPQFLTGTVVQKVGGRHMIDPHQIEATLLDHLQIFGPLFAAGKLDAPLRTKGPISHAAREEFLAALEEKLGPRSDHLKPVLFDRKRFCETFFRASGDHN